MKSSKTNWIPFKDDRENIPTKTTKENTDIMTHFICECFHNMNSDIWVKVFKNGPSQICGRLQRLHFKFFEVIWSYMVTRINIQLSGKNSIRYDPKLSSRSYLLMS